MRKIGYARASTSTQNLDRQIGALRADRCHEVYRKKVSGAAIKGRPQLEKAIDALGVARERVDKGESARTIAREWGVAHTTVARTVA